MCGISGIVTNHPLSSGERTTALQLNNCIEHRGPDGEGWYEGKTCQLGMRRLSIIDVVGANQPLYNEDESVVVLFNGEIYNFVELRQELERQGHTFRTNGDGETICHLYEDHGIDCLKFLRGMFAITLYDLKKNVIYLIRDRLGEKPIYYTEQAGTFYYASEFKALAKLDISRRWTLNPDAVNLFLHYQYIPEPHTMVQEVTKLLPAHYLQINLRTMEQTIERYWDMTAAPAVTLTNPADAVHQELITIGDIIGRSDVPVGIALSGGLDSSTIAALVKLHNSNKDIAHAFTVGYAERPPSDERAKAKILADQLGIQLHEIELKTADFIAAFPALIASMDDPIADIAAYSIDQVMRAAHDQGIKVMLNGIGGDEFFWGYQWINDGVKQTNACIAAGQTDTLMSYQTHPDYRYAEQVLPSIYTKAFRSKIHQNLDRPFYQLSSTKDIPVQAMSALCSAWLYSDPITLGDRLSMAHHIELRSPFLDYKLVELAVGLNKTIPELSQQPIKQLLKDAMATLLSPDILTRPKQGFTPPVAAWYLKSIQRYGKFLFRGYLMQHGILSWKGYLRLLVSLKVGQMTGFLYKCIVLEIWCRIYLNHQPIDSF